MIALTQPALPAALTLTILSMRDPETSVIIYCPSDCLDN